jgi:hypothetical protein
LAGVGDAVEQRWRDTTMRHQTDLERLLFDDRPRLTLQAPTQSLGIRASGRALVAIQRHPFQRIASLPAFLPPEENIKNRLGDALPACAVLLTYVVLLSSAAAVVFCRIRF